MDQLLIPITERCRKYGYIYWTKPFDSQVKEFFGDAAVVRLIFENAVHGKKNVDWRHRRISIGWRWTRQIPTDRDEFLLTWKDKKTLNVICR